MKNQLEVEYIFVSGQIMVQLDIQQFEDVVAEEDLIVIHGFVKEPFFSSLASRYYYVASNGTLTYYYKTSKPTDEITPNIIAKKMRIQVFPPIQHKT